MTPKEKARELYEKFKYEYNWVEKDYNIDLYRDAKQSSLIAVDEILEEISEVLMVTASSYVVEHIVFWQEVKQEIEKYG